MSLMERVREIGAEEARIEEESVDLARMVLLREAARGARAARAPRRRVWTGVGIGGLVAGAAATAIVVGSVLAPPAAPSASAAEALNAAADATMHATVLAPAPGQYIRIQEVSTQTLGWTPDPASTDRGWLDSRGAATEVEVREARSLYVPADRTGDWVHDYDESTEILSVTGPDADSARALLEKEGAGPGLGVEVYPGGVYSVTRVGAEGVDPADVNHFHFNALDCYYDEMPRDPQSLVDWMNAYEHEYLSECAPPRLGEPVEFNLAPADLRVAMFRALALVEGAEVLRVDDDITTIAFPEGGESDWMQTIDVDTAQGLVVGRGDLTEDGWSSRVFVTIVDDIPASVELPRDIVESNAE